MKRLIFLSVLFCFFLAACGSQSTDPEQAEVIIVPTAAAVAEVPTLPPPVIESTQAVETPTEAPTEATADVESDEQENVEEDAETDVEEETASNEEVVPEEPTPDLSIEPAVNITNIGDKSGKAGELLVVAGRAARRTDQRLEASLVTLDGRVLLTQAIDDLDFGAWEASIPLPETFSGQARLVTTVWNADETSAASDTLLVNIEADTSQVRYLQLDKPGPESISAAGYYLFFDGFAQKPVDFVVTIAVKVDDCQTIVSRQRFPMNGSGNWRGFVQVPEDVRGEACAIAWFGEEGSADRREAQYLIDVISKEEGAGTVIGWPKEGSEISAGETVFFQGVALNATDGKLDIQVRLADGSVAAGNIVDVQQFGYWEAELLMPVDLQGEVQVTADGGTGADVILLTAK